MVYDNQKGHNNKITCDDLGGRAIDPIVVSARGLRGRRHAGPGTGLRGGPSGSGHGARMKRGEGVGGRAVLCGGARRGGGSGRGAVRLPLGLEEVRWVRKLGGAARRARV